MFSFPDSYPSPSHLPFNRTLLEEQLEFATPDADPGGPGYWLLLQASQLLILPGDDGPQLPFSEKSPVPAAGDAAPLFIGLWQQKPCRLLPVSRSSELPPSLQAENPLSGAPQLPLELLSLAGLGNMILHWERTSRHCGNCGSTMQQLPGEWGKDCPACQALHYPRVHPCVIVLVQKGEELLLVRKAEWPQGRFGLVAGFVDFAENLEEAVARELLEETGIRVQNIRYLGSQCWPFPSQLMAGFVADYAAGEICLQEEELEEAGWFHRDRLPTLPPKRSIARYLIDQVLT